MTSQQPTNYAHQTLFSEATGGTVFPLAAATQNQYPQGGITLFAYFSGIAMAKLLEHDLTSRTQSFVHVCDSWDDMSNRITRCAASIAGDMLDAIERETNVRCEMLVEGIDESNADSVGPLEALLTTHDFVTLAQLVKACGVDAAHTTPKLESELRQWIEIQGWTQAKRGVDGSRSWGYVKPEGWRADSTKSEGGAA